MHTRLYTRAPRGTSPEVPRGEKTLSLSLKIVFKIDPDFASD